MQRMDDRTIGLVLDCLLDATWTREADHDLAGKGPRQHQEVIPQLEDPRRLDLYSIACFARNHPC